MPTTTQSPAVRSAALLSRLGVAARLGAPGGVGAGLEGLRPAAPVRVEASRPAQGPTVLRTERLVLRPLLAQDREEYLRVLRVSRRHLAETCPLTTDERGVEPDEAVWERQLLLARRAEETGLAWRRVAVLAAGPGPGGACGRIVGAVNVNDLSRGLEHTGELVFWVAGDASGMGIGTEMVRAAVGHALADMPAGLGLHRLSALIAPGNARCVRLARQVGLRLDTSRPPTALRLGPRTVLHDAYAAYPSVGPVARAARRVVEGKPSVAHGVLGQGILSILRTERAAGEAAGGAAGTGPSPGPHGEHGR
jgi:RimJ/RimL family protein N-acetyltransferase